METEMKTQHKTLGEMLLRGDFAKSEEVLIDGKHWQQVLHKIFSSYLGYLEFVLRFSLRFCFFHFKKLML